MATAGFHIKKPDVPRAFSDENENDLAFYTQKSEQSILLGSGMSGSNTSMLKVTANAVTVNGSILPGSNLAYDLGSADARFRDIFLSGSTIDLGGLRISKNTMNNVEFRDSITNQLRSLTVDQVLLGNPQNPLVLSANNGNLSVTQSSDPNAAPSGIDASAITSGVFASARLPIASTSNPGIVQLTSNVASPSTSNAPSAAALSNVHSIAITACNLATTKVSLAGDTMTGTLTVPTLIATTAIQGPGALITNINASNIATGTLAAARLPDSGATAATYGSTTQVPTLTIDAKGRITTAINTTIQTASTTAPGIVQLNDTVTSTSTAQAATANATKQAYDLASTANTTAISGSNLANTKVSKGGDTMTGTLTVPTLIATTAIQGDGAQITNLNATNIASGTLATARLPDSGATAGAYGSTTSVPVLTIDAKGRITSATTAAISATPASASTTQAGIVQLNDTVTSTSTTQAATANAAKQANDNANTRVAKAGDSMTGKLQVLTGSAAPPSIGAAGGNGNRIVLWPGDASSHPFSFGIDNNTMWYGVPSTGLHNFYVGGTSLMSMNSTTMNVTGTLQQNGTNVSLDGHSHTTASITSGTFTVDRGGTGQSTLTANKFVIGNGTSSVLTPTNLHWDNTNNRMGINQSVPSQALDVTGNIYCSGDVTVFSDARLKMDVTRIENALSKLQQINGYTFTRKDVGESNNGGKRFAGVIAQEILPVLPEVVTEREGDGMLSVAYGNIVALLIEAVKELAGRSCASCGGLSPQSI